MDHPAPRRPPIWRSPSGLVLLAAAAFGAYVLLIGHFDHLLQAVPFLILLACPLMHLFHRGHHGRHGGGEPGGAPTEERPPR